MTVARAKKQGKVRPARLTDLAALGELSRLCQSDDPAARSLGLSVSGPPIAGPAMAPTRNPVCHMLVALPRWSASTTRSSSEMADTVNIADPTPPIPRSSSSWV